MGSEERASSYVRPMQRSRDQRIYALLIVVLGVIVSVSLVGLLGGPSVPGAALVLAAGAFYLTLFWLQSRATSAPTPGRRRVMQLCMAAAALVVLASIADLIF